MLSLETHGDVGFKRGKNNAHVACVDVRVYRKKSLVTTLRLAIPLPLA
jgi:hypothetical protein